MKWVLYGIALVLSLASGCSQLRLPAIDSTGRRIFAPLPTTTTLALPGSQGEGIGCLRRMNDPLNLTPFSVPDPAFTEPVDPPLCLTPTPTIPAPAVTSGASNQPCVPSPPCNGDCKNGPPAVLLGRECLIKNHLKMPKRGKRGCILLTPQKIVAPVGGEVILLSGICGTDGYLQVGEPLEWMLTPESVGTFIQVGDDDPGILHRLARIKKASKQDGSFAMGVTSTKRMLITRGNTKPNDDVQLEKGQTWISVSSPSEGTSKVTVLAPESDCWDQRKATATIYWVDAKWLFPSPQIVPAGTPVQLTTRVTRSEGVLPARGWKVRYEIMNPDLATFADTNGSSVVEATVDDSGNATATLLPNPDTSGTATILMKVIRPGGDRDNVPTLELSQGQTFVTWSAPQLAIRAGAPETAGFRETVQAVANVSNPGNEPLNNVRVSVQFPNEINAVSPDAFATNIPGAVVWEIPTIPPQTQLDLFLNVTATNSIQLNFEARSESGLYASAPVDISVYRPALLMTIRPLETQYEVGQQVPFEIDLQNTGDVALKNVEILAQGSPTMLHELGEQGVRRVRETGPLQPGEIWEDVAVVFVPTEAGQKCVNFTATASPGQRTIEQSCVLVVNKPVPTPSITADLTGRERLTVGETTLFRSNIVNNGQVPLENIRVVMIYDPQLQPVGATDEADVQLEPPQLGQYKVSWLIPRLEPGNVRVLEAQFETIGANPRSQFILTAESGEGARDNDNLIFEILPRTNVPAQPGPRAPDLPPATPAPEIPGGRAPTPVPGTNSGNTPTPIPSGPAPSPRRLLLTITPPASPVRVGEPIRYQIKITNDSDLVDGGVSVGFNLPDGVVVDRVTHMTDGRLSDYRPAAGYILLPKISNLQPGESTEFVVQLISNQPQTITVQFDGASQQDRDGTSARVTTQVVP